jgi:hypothetical protein
MFAVRIRCFVHLRRRPARDRSVPDNRAQLKRLEFGQRPSATSEDANVANEVSELVRIMAGRKQKWYLRRNRSSNPSPPGVNQESTESQLSANPVRIHNANEPRRLAPGIRAENSR